MAIQMKLNWTESMQFVARSENGPAIVIDSKDGGSGPTPMELLLAGIAGCTGIDIVLILQKKRLELNKLEINISGKQAGKYPKRFTDIHIEYFLAGKNIPFKAVEQAIKLSEEKYCSALASFNAKFSHSYRIENKEQIKPLP
jgi:putative redox protein